MKSPQLLMVIGWILKLVGMGLLIWFVFLWLGMKSTILIAAFLVASIGSSIHNYANKLRKDKRFGTQNG